MCLFLWWVCGNEGVFGVEVECVIEGGGEDWWWFWKGKVHVGSQLGSMFVEEFGGKENKVGLLWVCDNEQG